jgi:hypothetical protein
MGENDSSPPPSPWSDPSLPLAAAGLTIGVLFFLNYPEGEVSRGLLGSHAAAGSAGDTWNRPMALVLRNWSLAGSGMWAMMLLVMPPIITAWAAYRITRLHDDRPSRIRLLVLSFLCGLSYLVYFGETYHTGVLSLALLAWFIALSHSAEVQSTRDDLTKTRTELGDARKTLKDFEKRLHYSYSSSLGAFYEDFQEQIAAATSRIHSVERFWTMSTAALKDWEPDAINERENFASILQSMRRDRLYLSLCETKARDILFIGPPPLRQTRGGYEEKELGQLYSLMYTSCILELVRTERMRKEYEQSSNTPPPGGSPNQRLRVRCAVADVPAWVKLVDNGFFDMFGTPPQKFGYEWSAAQPTDSRQDQARHMARVAQYERIILAFENYTQRAYTYVSCAILGARQPGTSGPQPTPWEWNDFLHGREPKIEVSRPRSADMLEHAQGLWLLKFFLALHFRTQFEPSASEMERRFTELTYAEIWARCS